MPRTYLDFDLLIERAEGGYRARVLDSPTGQAMCEFALPYSSLEMENLILKITRSLGDARRKVRRLESTERELLRGFGTRLFGAVFSGAVQGALQSSMNEAYRRNAGLRVRLRLTDTPELADVPWEFLHNPSANQFLGLNPDTPLVRYLDMPTAARPLAVTPPIRILAMISSPTDYPQLDVAAEWERLNSSLGDLVEQGLVSLTRLPSATLASLQRPLRVGEYHIFHFLGHGGFDERSQEGALLLEDAHGRGRLVSGQDLGIMLTGHRSLRLVVLNACEGARSSSADPFAGVAQSLIQQAIPAVIAMQFEITDDAAITFAHEFYGAVADGYPVDAAMAESRRAIFAEGNEVEWATPVLYMRSPNGQLFRLARKPSGPSTEMEPGAAETEAESEVVERQAQAEVQRAAAEAAVREQAQREAAELAAREQAEREAREAAEQQRGREEADLRAREQREREAAEQQRGRDQVEHEAREPESRIAPKEAAAPGRKSDRILRALPAVAGLLLLGGTVLPFASSSSGAKYLGDIYGGNLVEPFVGALVVGFVALRWRSRGGPSPLLDGLLIGTGLTLLSLFVAYSSPGDAFCGALCSLTPGVGVFAGMAGGGLAVAAGLWGARRRRATFVSRIWSRRLAAAVAAAAVGGLMLILATISSSYTDDGMSILRDISAFALPVLVMASLGIAGAIGVIAAPSRRGVVAGVLLGVGVQAFLFFVVLIGYVGHRGGRAGSASLLGLLGATLLIAGGILSLWRRWTGGRDALEPAYRHPG